MEKKVSIRLSNRHVHLTKEVYELLFDEEMTKRNDLSQPGQFVSNQKLSILVNDKRIDNIVVMGPFREYNQVEVSMKDARGLGVKPPVRRSGDLNGALDVILETPKASVSVKAMILANRHLHISDKDADILGLKDKQIIQVKIPGDRSGIVDVEVKTTIDGVMEVHLDTDDGNAFLINDGDEGTLII